MRAYWKAIEEGDGAVEEYHRKRGRLGERRSKRRRVKRRGGLSRQPKRYHCRSCRFFEVGVGVCGKRRGLWRIVCEFYEGREI